MSLPEFVKSLNDGIKNKMTVEDEKYVTRCLADYVAGEIIKTGHFSKKTTRLNVRLIGVLFLVIGSISGLIFGAIFL